MNNTFSFERFVKVLKYDLKFRVPAIGISFLILLLLPHVLKFIMDFGGTFHQTIRKEVIEILNSHKDKILWIKGNCDAEVDEMVLNFPVSEFGVLFYGGHNYVSKSTRFIFGNPAKRKSYDR